MAVAQSEASARVGVGLSIILRDEGGEEENEEEKGRERKRDEGGG